MKIVSVNHLISEYRHRYPTMYNFDEDTLKFFGERKSEMRLLKQKEVVKDYNGDKHTCYVLSTLQRKHPLGPTRIYHYFDEETLKCIIPN